MKLKVCIAFVAAVFVAVPLCAQELGDKIQKELITKITKNLSAKELLQMFTEYPIREYPEVEVVDPKSSIFYYI